MNQDTNGLSIADSKDRHAGLAAWGLLALGLKYAADAGMHFVGQEWARILDFGGIGLTVAAVIMIVPIFLWKFRHRAPEQSRIYFDEQSYTADSIKRAHVASWATTLVALVILEVVSKDLPDLPSAFFLQVVLAAMFASLSVTYLVRARAR